MTEKDLYETTINILRMKQQQEFGSIESTPSENRSLEDAFHGKKNNIKDYIDLGELEKQQGVEEE